MNKMKQSMLMVCGFLLAGSISAQAGNMIADAAGKTGEFSTKLTGYSAEATHDAIAKRMSQKGYSKHDLSQTTADIFVPKSPGKDGKYGLIIAQNFREYGKPPTAWQEVLEKYHLIWIGFEGMTDGTPALTRAGLSLDAVYNAENTWSIDMNRVYLFNCSLDHPGAELALYYPEVFTGSISAATQMWFHGVQSSKQKGLDWNFTGQPKPDAQTAKLGKTRKFIVIDRVELGATDNNSDVVKNGYVKDGYTDTKILTVKTAMTRDYMRIVPDWFDASIQFLDSAPAKTPSVALTALADDSVAGAAPAPGSEMAKSQAPATNKANSATTGPAGKAVAAATKPAAPAIQVPTISEADLNEEKANKALSLAKSYYVAGQTDIAKSRLAKVIQQYPKTPAAKEARSILDQMNAQP